jgi:hypothetical protein
MRGFVWFNWKSGGDVVSPVPGVPMRWVSEKDVTLLTAEPENPFAWMDEGLGI